MSSLGSTPTAQISTRLSRTHRPSVESLDRPFFIQQPDDDSHDSIHGGSSFSAKLSPSSLFPSQGRSNEGSGGGGGGGGASASSPFLKSFRAAQQKKKERKGGMSSGMGSMTSRSVLGMLGRGGRGDGSGDGGGDEEEMREMRRARMKKRSEWLRSPVKLRAAFSRYKYTVYTVCVHGMRTLYVCTEHCMCVLCVV
jgi:hypothetical protein